MWKTAFFITIFFAGSLAFMNRDCNIGSCGHILPDYLSHAKLYLLNRESLKESCPNILRYIECIKNEIQRCEKSTLEELSTRDDKDIAAFGGLLYGSSNLAIDLCDENTETHRAFVANIDCIKRTVLRRPNDECLDEAESVYFAYVGECSTVNKHQCLVSIYAFACVSEDVQKKCGEEARRIFVELLKRSRAVHYPLCAYEDFLEFQTKFRKHLQLEGERRRIFEEAFEKL